MFRILFILCYYIYIILYRAARPTTAAASILLYWKSLDKTKSALVIILPRDKSKYTHTHTHTTTNTCKFGYANRDALRAYKSRRTTSCELVRTCILYYTYDGAPVYYGLVGYNKNNKNILLGVIHANCAKGFSATTCGLYRASQILSADE